MFKLDVGTGILYPAERLEGKPREFHLVVEGRDEEGNGPHADTTTVDIEIRDVNQNKPVFIMPSLPNATIEVPEVCSVSQHVESLSMNLTSLHYKLAHLERT